MDSSIKMYYRMGDFLNDMFYGIDSMFPVKSYSFTGNIYNPETHDIVPKKDFLDKEIARKEEQLKHTEEIHRQQEERLREEISALKDQRKRRDK